MFETSSQGFTGVAEMLLIPLYNRGIRQFTAGGLPI
jgi:hypothetical protein